MANPEHVEPVRTGAETIAEWRRANPKTRLDFSKEDLHGVNLNGADLSGARFYDASLTCAKLSEADLSKADLSGADLSHADLSGANLKLARLNAANLSGANLSRADLRWARFCGADFSVAKLRGADLRGADLRSAHLDGANLSGANLSWANLSGANLSWANLSGANLGGAYLGKANLSRADLSGTNLSAAHLACTVLADVNLGQTAGLGAILNEAPSSVDIDALMTSVRGAGDRLPEVIAFLHDAGVPQELLDALPAILAKGGHSSCYISYGEPDLRFAKRLHENLRAAGVSCWLREMHMWPEIRTWQCTGWKRREADRMVILCSARSLVRDAVRKEIDNQIDENPDKLMPVSLDDDWKQDGFKAEWIKRDLKPFLVERNCADFAGWGSDAKHYNKGLEELLRGLEREKLPE